LNVKDYSVNLNAWNRHWQRSSYVNTNGQRIYVKAVYEGPESQSFEHIGVKPNEFIEAIYDLLQTRDAESIQLAATEAHEAFIQGKAQTPKKWRRLDRRV